MNNLDALHARAKALCLHGLLAHWHDATAAGWLHTLIEWEEQERARRSLERRLKEAHIGRFKPLCDFDWSWPKRCDQAAIEALMTLEFLNDATNAILVGPNGIGKSTLAQNIAHQAVLHGHTALCEALIEKNVVDQKIQNRRPGLRLLIGIDALESPLDRILRDGLTIHRGGNRHGG